jgi:hypothetical protein
MEMTSPDREFDAEEIGLRRQIERLLSGSLGRSVEVTVLSREPSPFTSLSPAEVVSVRVRGAGEMSLFVKHLGPEESEHPEKRCRDREVRVYEELLDAPGLPTAAYYGSRRNEATDRLEVYLEHIGDWDLRYQDLEHWFTAARRLAQFHAHFATRAAELLACEFLIRFDGRVLSAWAGRAMAVVREFSPGLAAELEGPLGIHGRVAELLSQQPSTLVHNDLAPKNVLADRSSHPARICFVDWEMAGVGCGLMDLVVLKHGLDPKGERKMSNIYCGELAGADLLPDCPHELTRLFAACELHRAVYRLAHSKAWGLPIEKVAAEVGEVRRLGVCF